MIGFDHRYVLVIGLLLACLLYSVPFYALLSVAVCGIAAYIYKLHDDGWRLAFAFNDGYYGFMRRRRRHSTMTPTGKPSNSNRTRTNLSFSGKPPPWSSSSNCSMTKTPRLRLDFDRVGSTAKPVNRTNFSSQKHFESNQWLDSSKANHGEICNSRPKFTSIGVYPFVQLEPRRPALLSYCNSSMVKNKVTVKVALPDRTSGYCANPLAGVNVSSGANSSSNTSMDCTNVIEALRTTSRKRPLKEDATNQETVSTKRRFRQSSDISSNMSPHLPTEIAQHFESQLSDESLAILLPPISTSPPQTQLSHPSSNQIVKKINPPSTQLLPSPLPRPAMYGRAKMNDIDSSYSSSRRHVQSLNERRMKRKNEAISKEAPGAKIVRNLSESIANDNGVVVPKEKSQPSIAETINLEPSLEKNNELATDRKAYSFHSTLTGTRNPMAIHVPNYIPSLEDHLEDQRANKKRLEKLLGCFSTTSEKERIESHVENLEKGPPSLLISSTLVTPSTENNKEQEKEKVTNNTLFPTSVGSMPPSLSSTVSNSTVSLPSLINSIPQASTSDSKEKVTLSTAVPLTMLGPQFFNKDAVHSLPVRNVSANHSTTTTTLSMLTSKPKDNHISNFGSNLSNPAFTTGNANTQLPSASTSSAMNGLFDFGGGVNGVVTSTLNPPQSSTVTAALTTQSSTVTAALTTQSSMFNLCGNLKATPFDKASNGDGSQPSTGNGNAATFANVNNTKAQPSGGFSFGNINETKPQPPGGFSFNLQTASQNNTSQNQTTSNNGIFTFGGNATTASVNTNPAFNLNASSTPNFNFAGATTAAFTPVAKLPETPNNMFSVTSVTPVSARRSKQTLMRHRTSHR